MALNLKNIEVERLAAEVARLTGESNAIVARDTLLFVGRDLSRTDITPA